MTNEKFTGEEFMYTFVAHLMSSETISLKASDVFDFSKRRLSNCLKYQQQCGVSRKNVKGNGEAKSLYFTKTFSLLQQMLR